MLLDRIESAWTAIRDALAGVPDSIIAALVVGVAVTLAVALHGLIAAVARRALSTHRTHLRSLLVRMDGPLRLAMVLLALNFAVALAPIEPPFATILSHALQLAFIGFIGWMLIVATNLAAELYMRRFDIEAEDNLLARKHVTQVRVLKGMLNTLLVLLTVAAALMTFDQVRQYGVSLFASAGIAGIMVGLAARPVLSNLLAGIQLAITQPIRIEDAVIVESEFGFIEEITATYVVIRLWDWRRLIVPLSYFIEKPFQNWTRETGALIGNVTLRADYTVPVASMREKLKEIVRASPLWDGRVVALQVTDADDRTVELRALASARTASATFDLRCEVREKLIAYMTSEFPHALPQRRQFVLADGAAPASADVTNR
jgi:small-conductance mechanosensitive channel